MEISNQSLKSAIMNGDVALLKKLLEAGVSVDDIVGNNGSSLHVAGQRGNLEIAEILIGAGGNINLKNDEMGATPLMIAVDNGQLEMAKYLIDKGADVNLKNSDGATALLYARCIHQDKREKMVSLLIASGAR